MSGDQIRLDATSLRGIAHPLRVRILAELRHHGPATATTLAERLGQSTGATSYHLRQLAAYGFVVEDPERGVGRERWWKAAHRSTFLEGDATREAPLETEAYLRSVAAYHAEQLERWLSERVTLPVEWQDASDISDWRLPLTAAEAKELGEQIAALVGRYRRHAEPGDDVPPGATECELQVHLMPFLDLDGADRP